MCLKNAIACCGEKKEFELVKERATLMLGALDEEMKKLEEEEASNDGQVPPK